ncbi:MAG: thiamine phosphate synthase [Chitinophagales bacterium]
MNKEISPLHFLTMEMAHRPHQEQVRIACESGIKWIQLRVKNKPVHEWILIGEESKRICDKHGVTLIINDSIEVAKSIDAHGVHLGQEDQAPAEAVKILGKEKIIGFSVHSLEELIAARYSGADYFGLGPFRFTPTKENLNPVLGMDKMTGIILNAKKAGIAEPVIAIGGIMLNDVSRILAAGAYGVAVSSAINLAKSPGKEIKKFLFYNYPQHLFMEH